MLKDYLYSLDFIKFVIQIILTMKIFTYIIILIAIGLIIFNFTLLDFENLLQGDSLIALIGIIAILCAVLVLLIFRLSKSIEDKLKNN
jgi:hypothetical protein